MKQNSLKKNFIYNALYQILLIIVPLITSPYLTRTIGADGLGVYSFTNSYAHYFVLFILLGLNNYGNREIARVRDDKAKTSKVFSEIFVFQAFMLVVVSAVYLISVFTVIKENRNIYVLQYMYVLSAGFDINWCCFGLEKFKLTVTRNSIIKILSAVAIFALIHQPTDVWKYTFIVTFSTLISQLVVWPFILNEIKLEKPHIGEVAKHIKPNLLLFLPVIAISLYTIMDKLMLGIIDTKAEVAYYTYAERIIQIPLSFITALGTVMLPRASNMMHTGKASENLALMKKSMQFSLLLSIGSTAGIMAIANELIPWYYGESFSRCAVFTVWLAPVVALTSWNTIIRTQYVIPRELDRIYLVTVSVGAIINLILNALLIPSLRGIGAIIGTLAAQFAVCFVQYLLIRNEVDYRAFVPDMIGFLLIGSIMGAIVWCLPHFPISDTLSILTKMLIGIIIYGGLSLAYLLIKKDYWLINSAKQLVRRNHS